MKNSMQNHPWTKQENSLVDKYFRTNMNELTLFTKLIKINPLRTFKSITRKIEDMKADGNIKDREKTLNSLKVGYMDIEATQLVGNFGIILSWAIKEKNKKEIAHDVVNKKELFNGTMDKRVVTSLLKELDKYDVIYAHYGSERRFDYPFIRTRAYKHGLQNMLPKKNTQFLLDTYDIAKNKLKLHSNRLDAIAEAVGITKVKKTPLSGDIWNKATYGDNKALKYILDHNIKDVKLLEAVHKKLEPIEKKMYRSV